VFPICTTAPLVGAYSAESGQPFRAIPDTDSGHSGQADSGFDVTLGKTFTGHPKDVPSGGITYAEPAAYRAAQNFRKGMAQNFRNPQL
jgi:hypothetical protein